MDELTEAIADAIAEEEVAKDNGYTIPKFKGDNDGTTVNISVNLEEYIMLRRIREDHFKFLNTLDECFRWDKYGKDIELCKDHLIIGLYRALYPEAYQEAYCRLKPLDELKPKNEEE